LADTVPTVGEMEREVAPEVLQLNVVDAPRPMVLGLAAKRRI
jgi:hypothetical protein